MQLSAHARQVEYELAGWRDNDSVPNEKQLTSIADKIELLCSHSTLVPENVSSSKLLKCNEVVSADLHSVVYLLEDDLLFAESLQLQLGYFGYDVEYFVNTKSLREALQ